MTAFLDLPAASLETGVEYWRRVTGYEPSPRRGGGEEFLTLVPSQGGSFLKMQATAATDPGVHLDLHADDVGALTDRAAWLGASSVADHESYRVLASPGG